MNAVTEVLADLRALFREQGIAWYVFGAQAVVVHGRPRMTADIDVTIDCSSVAAAELTTALEDAGFAVRVDDVEAFARRTRVVPVVHEATGIPVDLVLAGPGLEQQFLNRAGPIEIEDIDVPFITAEDLIVSKMLAGRSKDLDDVRGILAEQGDTLDRVRIEDVLRRLEQALDRSDLLRTLERLS